MLNALNVACYFILLDKEKKIFTKTLVERNGRSFWDGNAKLNKFLHLVQNLYIAKNERPLFKDDLFAYDNGAVVPEILENYSHLLNMSCEQRVKEIPEDKRQFLDKFFCIFKNATLEELIELSHEDDEWREKSAFYKKNDQKMDTMSRVEEYKKQYADVILIMDRVAC